MSKQADNWVQLPSGTLIRRVTSDPEGRLAVQVTPRGNCYVWRELTGSGPTDTIEDRNAPPDLLNLRTRADQILLDAGWSLPFPLSGPVSDLVWPGSPIAGPWTQEAEDNVEPPLWRWVRVAVARQGLSAPVGMVQPLEDGFAYSIWWDPFVPNARTSGARSTLGSAQKAVDLSLRDKGWTLQDPVDAAQALADWDALVRAGGQ